MVSITEARPPEIGVPATRPVVPLTEYEDRISTVARVVRDRGLDFLLVYADREHCGHQAYLCGVEPRFEESLLILGSDDRRILILGNECQNFAPDPALNINVWLFQDFSPIGQSRSESESLASLLAAAGISTGARVGVAGWKYFDPRLVSDAETALDVPAFIADTVRELVGDETKVTNENEIFLHPVTGLRVTSSAAQIAEFEFASCATSNSVRDALLRLKPNVREYEIERSYVHYGLPASCHSMVSFGDKVKRGLSSPSDREAKLGDSFSLAFGLRGALTCRAGAIAASHTDLSRELRDFYPAFASNYFDVIATWYESVRTGVTAGSVFESVDSTRDRTLYDFMLNPGHYLHIEEWSQSPFEANDETKLRSGMVMQLDIIPVSNGPFCYANVEDGVALADAELRHELQTSFPDLWHRVEARRNFMSESLGIDLHESVLPLSNVPAWHVPYALDPMRVFCR